MRKVCSKCQTERDIEDFRVRKDRKSGVTSWCKSCLNKLHQQYYQKYREEIRKSQNSYAFEHKLERKQYNQRFYSCHKEEQVLYHKLYRRSHNIQISQSSKSIKGRYRCYKASAKANARVFDLTLEEFETITKQPCYYCGQFSENELYCGIDRKDSVKGYERDNILSCCNRCNYMKQEYSIDSFLNKVAQIAMHLKLIVR